MKEQLMKFLARREERMEFGGMTLIIRELTTAASLEMQREDPDLTYKLITQCVFFEDGTPAFTEQDIANLKASSPKRLGDLSRKVADINGFNLEEAVKK